MKLGHFTSLALLSGLLFVLTLTLYYPGFLSEDSLVQLSQGRAGVFTDAHPPLMAWMWGLVDQVYPGQTGFLILQLFTYWSGLCLIAWGSGLSTGRGIFFLLVVGLFPGTLGILGTLWKDLQLVSIGLLGFGLSVCAVRRKSWLLLILTLLIYFVGFSLRQNGIFALPPLLFGLAYSWQTTALWKIRIGKAIAGALLGTLVFFQLNHYVTYDLLKAEKTHLWRLLPMYDLAGIYRHSGALPSWETVPFATSSLTLESLQQRYSGRSMMPLILPFCGPSKTECSTLPVFDIEVRDADDLLALDQLKALWLQEIKSHPLAYLTHRLTVFSHLLGMHGDLWGPVFFKVVENKQGFAWEKNRLQKSVSRLLDNLSYLGFFSAWIFLILGCYLFVHLLRTPKSELWGLHLGGLLSGLFFEGAYLVIAPSMDYRYSLWFIVITVVVAYLLRASRAGPDFSLSHKD